MRKTIAILLITSSLFAGCGVPERSSTANYQTTAKEGGFSTTTKGTSQAEQTENRILVYSADLDMKVKNTDTANARIRAIAKKYDGYVVSLSDRNCEIRVVSDKIYDAVKDISVIGKVRHQNIYGQDITEEYTDQQIRLENAKKARERYLELLAKAENVDAALKVEKELERLNGDIDLLEGKIKKLDQLVDYSTITVYLQKKKKLGILGYVCVGVYKGVKWLFVRGN